MAAKLGSRNAPGWQFPKSRKYFYYTPQKLKELEQGFILDGVPLSKVANDETDRTNPTLNLGISQYFGRKDPHCHLHYSEKKLDLQENTARVLVDSSMMGLVYDKFTTGSAANKYIEDRKDLGAGYTRKIYGGHTTVPIAPPKPGYHGGKGYRRNTPSLRYKPSPFDIEARQNIRHYRAKSAQLYRQPPMAVIKKLSSSTVGFDPN